MAIPNVATIVKVLPPCLLLAGLQLRLVAILKTRFAWRDASSRKAFHFAVFFTAGFVSLRFGLQSLCLYGAAVSAWVWLAVLRGAGDRHFDCLARLSDAPHRRHFVILPWLSTLLGGLLTQWLWGSAAAVGYWVVGLADAIAEPIGLRWGKTRYRVPWNTSWRSLQGSLGIALVSTAIFVMAMLTMATTPAPVLELRYWLLAGLGGLVMAGLEGISPHGGDNFLLQVAATAWWVEVMV
jgi:dolichol kinase